MSLFDLALHAIDYLGTLVIVVEVLGLAAYLGYRFMTRHGDRDTALDRLLAAVVAQARSVWTRIAANGRARRLRH